MSKYLKEYHFFNENQIIEVKNPAYDNRNHFSEKQFSIPSRNQKILYACMGTHLFEQEAIFIDNLSEQVRLSGFDLEILMHPKFKTPNHKGINFKSISYEQFSTHDLLFEHLSNYRLILTAGSSIALDCFNYNLEFVCVFIEDLPIDYWRSIKRYTDNVEHFSDFLRLNNIKVIHHFDQLQIELRNAKIRPLHRAGASNISYTEAPCISDELINTINRIISQ